MRDHTPLQAKHGPASARGVVAAAACARQLSSASRAGARSLSALPQIDAFKHNNRFVARNIVCSAATATKEETFTYQAEVRLVGKGVPLSHSTFYGWW